MTTARRVANAALVAAALCTAPAPAASQIRQLSGVIRSTPDGTPVAGALLQWVADSVRYRSDHQGRFAIPRAAATLTIRAIGFLPRRVVVANTAPDTLTITLTPAALGLPDLIATNPNPLIRSGGSEWRVDGTATRVTPVAVEPDPFRILRLVPAVTFSSFLSARPLLRGFDADDAGFSIDGHEAINLFHLGRMFSAFPALGVGAVRVSTEPTDLAMGNTTSGHIAIDGLDWADGQRPELQYGLGAWSARAGWRRESSSGVLVGRTVQGAATGIAAAGSTSLSLNLYDVYGRFDLGGPTRPLRLTVFRSLDKVTDADPDDGTTPALLDWDNLILGATAHLMATARSRVTARVSYTSHTETADDIPGRGTSVDVENNLRRLGVTVDGRFDVASHFALRVGGDIVRRDLSNRLSPADPRHIPATTTDLLDTESALFGGIETGTDRVTLATGLRVDHAAGVASAQPRASLRAALGAHTWGSLGAGRASTLLHLVSDARTEPKLAYYDIWLPTDSATPAATTDNLTVDLGWQRGAAAFRIGGYLAGGKGQLDFGPIELATRDTPTLLRTGHTRTRGIEAEAIIGTPDAPWSGQLSYSMAWSDRDWGNGWVPWINDRRHVFRAAGVWRPSPRLFFSAGLEIASGLPYTPWLAVDSSGSEPRPVYGAENSARGRAVARLDLSVEKSFRGLFGTDMAVGFTVLNIAVGDQAPREPLPPRSFAGRTRTASQTMFTGVPVPSLLLRVMF
jgi:hypothetical protein